MDDRKRKISNTGYVVRESFRIGGKEILLAENLIAEVDKVYMVCQFADHGLIREYKPLAVSGDYFEALRGFTNQIEDAAMRLEAEMSAHDTPLFTVDDCRSSGESIVGEVVALKPSSLSAEYRNGATQLFYAVSGFGTESNARGSAVYGYFLGDGKHARIERSDVLGVVNELPDWAKESLERIRSEMSKPAAEKQYIGSYEILKRTEVGRAIFSLGHCAEAAEPYGTWQGRDTADFFWGHYFTDLESAKLDLHERVAAEQERISTPKLSNADNSESSQKSISERVSDYRASDEFKDDLAMYKNFAASVGSSETDEQIITEVLRAKFEELEAADMGADEISQQYDGTQRQTM